MKLSKIRTIVAAAVFCVLAVGLIAGINMGTLSGFGFDSFSALCPLGAITTMLATKTLVPRAVFSIIIMALLVFLFGRAFCGWICPVPVLGKLRAFFRSPKKRRELEQAKRDEALDIATRAGAHCAPRMHEALGTVQQGAVRFSFSYFNTENEVDTAIAAVRELAE